MRKGRQTQRVVLYWSNCAGVEILMNGSVRCKQRIKGQRRRRRETRGRRRRGRRRMWRCTCNTVQVSTASQKCDCQCATVCIVHSSTELEIPLSFRNNLMRKRSLPFSAAYQTIERATWFAVTCARVALFVSRDRPTCKR